MTSNLLRSDACKASAAILITRRARKSARVMMSCAERSDTNGDNEDQPTPGEQPALQESPPIDDAPVPPLTLPDDTQGG